MRNVCFCLVVAIKKSYLRGRSVPLNVDNDKITTQWSFICKPLILRMSIEGGGTKGMLAGVMYVARPFPDM